MAVDIQENFIPHADPLKAYEASCQQTSHLSQTVSGARRPWPGVVRLEAERAETSAKAGGSVYESRS